MMSLGNPHIGCQNQREERGERASRRVFIILG